jgi:hypothetical protein
MADQKGVLMALTDYAYCLETPCRCGLDYSNWATEALIQMRDLFQRLIQERKPSIAQNESIRTVHTPVFNKWTDTNKPMLSEYPRENIFWIKRDNRGVAIKVTLWPDNIEAQTYFGDTITHWLKKAPVPIVSE